MYHAVSYTINVNNRKKVLTGRKCIFLAGLFVYFIAFGAKSFAQQTGDTTASYSLSQCIDYAMQHEPALQQSLVRMNIVKATNSINTSGWYPQVGLTANLNHYFQLPTSFSNAGGVLTPVKSGIINTSIPGIGITQTIYDPSLVYASRTASNFVKQAQQVTDSAKINIVVNVSKDFYNLLLTLLQLDVLKEDTARLGQSMRDAQHQYIGGIVDETDYEQAAISLNTSLVQLKQAQENIFPQYEVLKQDMGFPPDRQFNVLYDTTEMLKTAMIDTSKQLDYEKRIEYQELMTAKNLQHQQTEYYRKAYLPVLSAFYNYNHEFEKNEFDGLYSTAYPNSMIGLTLSMPIFTGFARTQSLHRSRLQEQLLDWSEIGLKSEVYSEYATALATSKGNLYNMQKMQENVALAKRVYFVVDLQYKQGIVPYLNVITAETNLRTSDLTYLNALFQVLSSKIDWLRAMGDISY
jgi:outer membrane protein TolC